MAAPKAEKKCQNEASFDLMWKMHIKAEEKAPKTWKEHWGWIVDEYRRLEEQLDEKMKSSDYLKTVNKKHKENVDLRRLTLVVPPTYNGWYGWLAKDEQFSLNKYGHDFFHPMPLPVVYRLIK